LPSLERIDTNLPKRAVQARCADDRVAVGGQLLELGHRPEGAVPIDDQGLLLASQHQLDLVAARLRQLDNAEPVGRNRPRGLATPDRGRAVRARDLLLDRVCKRRQVAVAFLDQD